METTNVGHKKNRNSITANMVTTRPGAKSIEILENGQFVNISEYLEKVGTVKIGLEKNSERELRAYLAKYADKAKQENNKESIR